MRWTGIAPWLAAMLGCAASVAVAQDNALHFDGTDDRVELPLPSVFADTSTQDFSVSTWLRLDSEGSVPAQRVFFAQQSSATGVTLLLSGTNMLLYVRRNNVTFAAFGPLPPGAAWSHVTATWQAATSTIALYVDGEALPLTTGGNTSTGTDGVMTLGSRTDGAQVLQGALDDFRLWPVTLTPEQVRVLARSTCVPEAPLAAHYAFDVGTPGGNNAGRVGLPDVSGFGAQGTLVNFALDGPTSNWIASGVERAAPALVFDPPLPEVLLTGEDGSGYSGSVRLAAPPLGDVTVGFAVDDATEAAVSADTLTFTTATWDVPQPWSLSGVDDAEVDGIVDYNLVLDVQTGDACFAGLDATHPARNVDNESASVVVSGAQQLEGHTDGNTLVFDLTLAAAVPGGLTVPYQTLDGSAIAGTDYVAASGSVAFAGTAGEVQQVAVTLLGNRVAQADRTLSLQVGPASLPQVPVLPAQVQGVIVDDDPATITASGVVQAEGDAGETLFVFALSLDTALPGPVSVPFHTVDGSAVAGVDYIAESGTVEFAGAAGEVQFVQVRVPGDTVVQGDRTFSLQLGAASSPQVGVAPSLVQAVIVDDDAARITVSDVMQAEGDAGESTFVFTLTLDADVAGGVTMPFHTQDGTAVAGEDYAAASGTVQFDGIAGEVQQVEVTVFGDTVAQGDRAFELRFDTAAPASVTLVPMSVAGVIVDDDLDVGVALSNGVERVQPGQDLTYVLAVTNHSPTLAAAPVQVTFATTPVLDDVRWTCTAFGGASCAAGASGGVDETVALVPGSSVVFAIAGSVPAMHAGGVIATATAILANDGHPENDTATDSDPGPVLFGDGFE
ncbi:Calx-beta domain-containing protein [Chiayiivirga flava]|uniref:DUF11 domain-containing protein n=1 Tax=Chiayiivirga flava TaxID=659595 RepID=A0A7W8D535_9GAMM|nr:Calx-beta domain-containing protein [Chiayiivirga flava]MBB5206851.1 hypothetical protein [Chiayiivirga flava]